LSAKRRVVWVLVELAPAAGCGGTRGRRFVRGSRGVRLGEVRWNKAPGGGGSVSLLASYGWAGGVRQARTVRYSGSNPDVRGETKWTYDDYGRLAELDNKVYTSPGTTPLAARALFEYQYDMASNLTKERYQKVDGTGGDGFGYDAFHRLDRAWMGGDAAMMASTSDPLSWLPSQAQEYLTYSHDQANNRTQSTSGAGTTSYTREADSNRYEAVSLPGASTEALYEYDERGNLKYDGRFVYRYDYLNRLQEVWRVLPTDAPPEDGEKYAAVQQGAIDDAEESVKLEVPDLLTRLAREHTNPTFRARLKASIAGGVIRITPSAQGGGGRPGWLPVTGTLELSAVYLYDAFNRRVTSILVDPSVAETQLHTWDGWQQTTQHRIEQQQPSGQWVAVPTKQFVWGSRLDELVAYRRLSGGAWQNYYLLHGGQETAAKLVDAAGNVVETYEYDPYGRVSVYVGSSATAVSASAYGLPFLWKSVRLDEITGLLQMRNRYYSVELGRFLTRDPLGVWGDGMNLGNEVGYAGNRPLVLGDPLGSYTVFIIARGEDENWMQSNAIHEIRGDPEGGMIVMVDPSGATTVIEVPAASFPAPASVDNRFLRPAAGSVRLVLTAHGYRNSAATDDPWDGLPVSLCDDRSSLLPAHLMLEIARGLGALGVLDRSLPIQVAVCFSESQSDPYRRFAARVGLAAGHPVWGYKHRGHLCGSVNADHPPGNGRCPTCVDKHRADPPPAVYEYTNTGVSEHSAEFPRGPMSPGGHGLPATPSLLGVGSL
jgi:RHS repeat-associated protein